MANGNENCVITARMIGDRYNLIGKEHKEDGTVSIFSGPYRPRFPLNGDGHQSESILPHQLPVVAKTKVVDDDGRDNGRRDLKIEEGIAIEPQKLEVPV